MAIGFGGRGYFPLGEHATVMVKPDSDLYRFLRASAAARLKLVLTEAGGPELSRLER